VDEERQRACDPEEAATDRRRGEDHGRLSPRDDRDRGRKLLRRHDGPQRPCLRRVVERAARPLDERNDGDHPEHDLVGHDQDAERPYRDGSDRVRADHHPPAAPPVGGEPGGQCEERARK
jgi:hypothetical protein